MKSACPVGILQTLVWVLKKGLMELRGTLGTRGSVPFTLDLCCSWNTSSGISRWMIRLNCWKSEAKSWLATGLEWNLLGLGHRYHRCALLLNGLFTYRWVPCSALSSVTRRVYWDQMLSHTAVCLSRYSMQSWGLRRAHSTQISSQASECLRSEGWAEFGS